MSTRLKGPGEDGSSVRLAASTPFVSGPSFSVTGDSGSPVSVDASPAEAPGPPGMADGRAGSPGAAATAPALIVVVVVRPVPDPVVAAADREGEEDPPPEEGAGSELSRPPPGASGGGVGKLEELDPGAGPSLPPLVGAVLELEVFAGGVVVVDDVVLADDSSTRNGALAVAAPWVARTKSESDPDGGASAGMVTRVEKLPLAAVVAVPSCWADALQEITTLWCADQLPPLTTTVVPAWPRSGSRAFRYGAVTETHPHAGMATPKAMAQTPTPRTRVFRAPRIVPSVAGHVVTVE